MKYFLIFCLFILSSNAINIDCTFRNHGWGVIGTVYTCVIKSSQIIANETYITGFTGTHVSGYANTDVRGFYFEKNCHHIKEVPSNIHEFFPNFIGISMWDCGVVNLSGNELKKYRNLQYFTVDYSFIERIPGNLFSYNPQMKLINFGNNFISRIGANLLEPIQNTLVSVSFLNNICVNLSGSTPGSISILINHIKIYCEDLVTSSDLEETV